MKAPSEGKPNTTMVTFAGVCAAAGGGKSAALASIATAHAVDCRSVDNWAIYSSSTSFAQLGGPLALDFLLNAK
jgi:hypothetical protein